MGNGRAGFTLIELSLALLVVSLLLVPLLRGVTLMADRKRSTATMAALHDARDALLAYAIRHNGCLPDAADFEGGQPDTDIAGNGNITDTGSVRQAVEPAAGGAGQRAGDIPWADLALPGRGTDGDGLRLQYYVAAAFTAPRQTRLAVDNPASRDGCASRLRSSIETWQSLFAYRQGDIVANAGQWYVAGTDITIGLAPPAAPWSIFGPVADWNIATTYTKRGYASYLGIVYRALADNSGATPSLSPAQWRAVGLPNGAAPPAWQSHASEGYRRGELITYNGHTFRALAVMTSPVAAPVAGSTAGDWMDITLPAFLLEARLGPQVNAAPGNGSASPRNIAVLIAPGRDQNAAIGRYFTRDASHMICNSAAACSPWTSLNNASVDGMTFSLTAAAGNSPDTILPISYADYQAALARANLSTMPVQY